jgi:DNA topoisomerase-1
MRKYVGFAGNSKVKTESDMKKYEKARELKKVINHVRDKYNLMMNSQA